MCAVIVQAKVQVGGKQDTLLEDVYRAKVGTPGGEVGARDTTRRAPGEKAVVIWDQGKSKI